MEIIRLRSHPAEEIGIGGVTRGSYIGRLRAIGVVTGALYEEHLRLFQALAVTMMVSHRQFQALRSAGPVGCAEFNDEEVPVDLWPSNSGSFSIIE